MLLLNEKETKILLDVMEFLENLETPEATKQAEAIDELTYTQTQGDADAIDLLLGCFNELDETGQEELIIEELYNLKETKEKEARKEIANDDGYHNTKLQRLYKEIENIENAIEKMEV